MKDYAAIARARAESIATRWVPAHMTARQGLVDDIAAALGNARQVALDDAEDRAEGECEFWGVMRSMEATHKAHQSHHIAALIRALGAKP
jgi:hypothetical protein